MTEAVVVHAADVHVTQAQHDTGTPTDVTTYPDGRVTLTPSDVATIAHTTGSDFITAINGTKPFHIVWWKLDDAIGAEPPLRKVQAYLSRRRVGANAAYDGDFVCKVWRLNATASSAGSDVWSVQLACDPIRVAASAMTTDAELVAFTFGTATTPATPFLGKLFLVSKLGLGGPDSLQFSGHRVVGVSIEAVGGSNSNYAWVYESGASADETTGGAGTLYHRLAAEPSVSSGTLVKGLLQNTTATGMPRITFTTGSFPSSGTLVFTGGAVLDLGASPTGTVEFVVQGSAPNGTSLLVDASDDGGSTWATVEDGDTPADVGLASQQTYAMRATLTTNATTDSTPTLLQMGVRDRTVYDWSALATWSGVQRSVNPLTGEYRISSAHLSLARTGRRDYRDIEAVFAAGNPTTLQVRHYWGASQLARAAWLLTDLWDLDTYALTETSVECELLGVAARLRGKFPRTTNALTGYILKDTASDLTGGANVTVEASPGTATTGSLSPSIAGSATEVDYVITPATVPNLFWWPEGDFTVTLRVTAANSNLHLKVRLSQISADGATVHKSTEYTEEQNLTATGTYTFTVRNVAWDAASVATRRLRVDISARNADAGAQSYTLETGTTNTQIIAPWTYQSDKQPVVFSAETLEDVYADWLAVTALPGRYIGPGPANSSDRLSKSVLDADGLEELSRIAFANGGCVMESQGLVRYVDLHKPTASVAAYFPQAEYTPGEVSQGLSARVPRFLAGYDWDGAKFQGRYQVEHAAALAAYGVSRIDNPDQELDEETAKYFLGSKLPAEVCRNIVRTMGLGLIRVEARQLTIPHPELDIGDAVAVDTDLLAFQDPATGEVIIGHQWAIGRIVALEGTRPDGFVAWIRGTADLFQISGTPIRQEPFEPVLVEPVDKNASDRPQVARVAFNVYPSGATVKYYYRAASASALDPESHRWSTYVADSVVEVTRDTAALKYLDFYGQGSNYRGAIRSLPIQPSNVGAITALNAAEDGAGTVTWQAAGVEPTVRFIRWYMRRSSSSGQYPTADGSSTGILDETYFIAERAVHGGRGGGLSQAHTGATYDAIVNKYATVVAVPIDYNGNPGTRNAATYTYLGASTATLTAISWTLNAAGSYPSTPRTYDFAWTPSGVADGTHYLTVYVQADARPEEVLFTEGSPNSVTSATNQATDYYARTGDPDHRQVFRWELRLDAGDALASSGLVSPSAGDEFQGGVVP